MLKLIIFLVIYCITSLNTQRNIPFVITTWNFQNSTTSAWDILKNGGSSLDAVERGASVCEELQCDRTVGFGGSPDENSETTLDALIMDGRTMNVGAVGCLRRIKSAISVARHILENTKHSFLVGDLATEFALQMGFKEESLTTPETKRLWMDWHNEQHCQPNFWTNVHPNPNIQCGPYHKFGEDRTQMEYHSNPLESRMVDRFNHDTIGMVAIDQGGNVAAGTSTNGARFKIPGRIGDSPIPGAGAYADNAAGGAAATGDGDIMLRFLPSFLAVEEMRRGLSPSAAAHEAVQRIAEHYPTFRGAIIALSKNGEHGAACHGLPTFPYVIQDGARNVCEVITINCIA